MIYLSDNQRPPRNSSWQSLTNAVYTYIQQIVDNPTRYQDRTIDNLWGGFKILLEAMNLMQDRFGTPPPYITDMLQGDVNINSHDFKQMIKMLNIQQAQCNVSQQKQTVHERIIERTIEQECNTQEIQTTTTSAVAAEVNTSSTKRSPEYKRLFKKQYIKLLSRMNNHDYGSDTVNALAKLLYQWYKSRFRPKAEYPAGFKLYKYGIQQITQGIYTIVLTYADQITQGCRDSYIADFNMWLNKIGTDKKATENDTLPVPIQHYMNNMGDVQIHIQTLLLWNALIYPFRQDIEDMYNEYSEAIYPEFFEDMIYNESLDDISDTVAELCNDDEVPYSVLTRYSLS